MKLKRKKKKRMANETIFTLDKRADDGTRIHSGMVFRTERFGNVVIIGHDTYGIVRPRSVRMILVLLFFFCFCFLNFPQ